MNLVLLILFACLCFVLPAVLYRMEKVSGLTVFFWLFFGVTAFLHAFVHRMLHGAGGLDHRLGFVGPLLVQIPFALMIYGLERTHRKPIFALLVALLGSFLVTGLWLLSSALFMR